MGSNITMVLTSCGRHDLLKQTLDSFISNTDIYPEETVIIEDGPTPRPEWLSYPQLENLKWLQNPTRTGQIYSIDRAYSEVKTDYIFHCEDDWLFIKPNFMSLSKDILDQYPEIILVSLRGGETIHPLFTDARYPFKILEPGWDRGLWGGLTFNPGLRRRADYTRIGSFGTHVDSSFRDARQESQLSMLYLSLGYVIAAPEIAYVQHIGWGRSTAV